MFHDVSTRTFESAHAPGTKITIRRLNSVQRAKRDWPIAKEQVEFSFKRARYLDMRERLGDPFFDPSKLVVEGQESKPFTGTTDEHNEMVRLDQDAGMLIEVHIKPATIRAGLVKIENYQIDGKEADVNMLIEQGEDAVINEVWLAIETFGAPVAAETTAEEQNQGSE